MITNKPADNSRMLKDAVRLKMNQAGFTESIHIEHLYGIGGEDDGPCLKIKSRFPNGEPFEFSISLLKDGSLESKTMEEALESLAVELNILLLLGEI